MLVEMRTYVLHPGTLPVFLAAYAEGPRALQQRILGRLLGYYVTETGALNTLVHLWAYDDFNDRCDRRAQLAANAEWTAFLATVLPLFVSQESTLLRPTDFSPS